MATMGSYCKAYPIERLRQYAGWQEKPLPPRAAETDDDETEQDGIEEEPYLFLQENYVVTAGIFIDEDIVFDDVTPEWKTFCEVTLEFQVPEEEPLPVLASE